MTEKTTKVFFIEATRVGAVNREIEKSISHVVSGRQGATGEAIVLSKRRQKLLSARPFKYKERA